MTRADRWDEIERHFGAALERPPEEREAFVRASNLDAELAAQVLALLAAHDRSGLFDRVTGAERTPSGLAEGTRLGAWEVIRELGRGGMGVVYLVRRADGQFEREAALKILPRVSLGPSSAARFLAERRILARLSHRYIATLLDGGVSEDGRPWFVLERVEGEPVDAYCDGLRLSVNERLGLFLRIGEAIQYAHQNLIVHRDLKPANILVTSDGEPRLLDFGIAKVLDDDLLRDASVTSAGTRVLTPEYASPEQLRGEPVTTASDVYQLGLLLWRLLAGGLPARAGAADVAGATTRDSGEATRPSRSLGTSADADEVAARRATTVGALERTLRGDLDSILMKALRPEPDERYGTAGQLADDVERYLVRRPVRARPDSWRYVSGKFVRRHAGPLALTGGAFLLVVGLSLGMRRQAIETALERDRAEQVVELLVGLFQSADPYQALSESTTVRDVMDQGVLDIRAELAGQPAVQAMLMRVIGEVYANLGLLDPAIELTSEALAVGTAAQGADDPYVALTERLLAKYHAENGDFAAAEPLLSVAEERLERLEWEATAHHAFALNDIGFSWQVLGRLDRAEPLLERAVAVKVLLPDDEAELAPTYTNLGWIRNARGDLDSAEVLFRKGLELRRASLGPDHVAVATSLEALGGVLSRKGALAEADSAFSAALDIRARVLDPGHRGILALRVQQASLRRRQGRPAEAEALLRSVLDAQIATIGENHFVVANTRNELAIALRDQGRNAEAEPYLRASLDGYRRAFGTEHVNPSIIEVSLARLLFQIGDHEAAEPLYAHALPILRQAYPGDPRFLTDLVDLGTIRCAGTDPSGALAVMEEGVAALGADEGVGTDAHLRALHALAGCLERHDRGEAARDVVEASLTASAGRADGDSLRAVALGMRERLSRR